MAENFRFMDPVQLPDGTYDREYNAQEFTDYFKALITTGVMKSVGGQLAVTANGSNMVTRIDTGIAFILGRYYENDSFKELTHDTETLGNSRIDRVVIRMDLSPDKRHVLAFIKKGAPSANPVPPVLTQTTNIYEISLAQVRIVGGQTFIAANEVTDERGKDIICPWAGSNILPSFDNNALATHTNNNNIHVTQNDKDYWNSKFNLNLYRQEYVDLNNFITPGVYALGNNLTNANHTYGVLYVATSFDVVIQTHYDNLGVAFVRSHNGGIGWSPWKRLLSVDDILQQTEFDLVLQSGWSGSLKCYKDTLGRVHIRGVLLNGVTAVGTRLFTLPYGYRPISTVFLETHTEDSANNGKSMLLLIGTDGAVTIGATAMKGIYINTSFRI